MLELLNIAKTFPGQIALQDVRLQIHEGEFFSLLGPSGCGKTTLLRILAGLEQASSGRLLLQGQEIQDLPPQKRPFHMVFQRYALFPHLSVEDNIAFGLKMARVTSSEARQRVREMLKLVDLEAFAARKPASLSGGQQQRVALARALVNRPQLLLLDEPLSALDQRLREQMQSELRSLQKRLGLTFIAVTHDQDEAMALSDRIGVMAGGRLLQVGTPQEVYEDPAEAFVAQFFGSTCSTQAEVASFRTDQDDKNKDINKVELILSSGDRLWAQMTQRPQVGDKVQVFFRPDRVRRVLDESNSPPAKENLLRAQVCQSHFRGDHGEWILQTEKGLGLRCRFPLQGKSLHSNRDWVTLHLAPSDLMVFAERP